jgi:hypothetical protein
MLCAPVLDVASVCNVMERVPSGKVFIFFLVVLTNLAEIVALQVV